MAHKRKLAAVMFSLGCLNAGSVWALGLGELTLESFLNEPLRAKVDLLNTGGLHEDQIRVRLATSDDFDRLGVDRAYFLTGIKFEVQIDDSGSGAIVLTSDDPVLEPYLDFIVETRWPSGRLLREYTILVDPPAFDQASPVVSASQRVEEVEGIPAPAKKKTEAGAGTGTKVDVRKSELAPGDMPQRDFGADTATAPAAGSRYMIRRDETLWQIARKARPEGVSTQQTMLDIQRLNPDAFIDGNINRIKAGYLIYLPDSGDISSGDMSQALAEIKQQNDDWRAGRASQSVAASGPALRISAAPEAGDDRSGADDISGKTKAAATSAELEELEKSQLERSDLQQQVSALTDQVQTLERIVDVKDNQIAALQAALAGNANATVEAEEGDADGLLTDATSPDSTASGTDDMDASTDTATDTVAAAPAVPVVATTEQPTPKPAPRAPVASQDEGSNSLWYILGALLLALLAGLFFWRRRNNETVEDEPLVVERGVKSDAFAGVKLHDQEVQVEDSLQIDEMPPSSSELTMEEEALLLAGSDRADRGYGQRKHDEYASDVDAGDALAEADIYIAYGRYPQAIDLLETAIAAEPSNAAYRLKLLELCAEVGRMDEAKRQYAELQAINDPASLEQAGVIMAGLDAHGGTASTADFANATDFSHTADFGTGVGDLDTEFSGLEIEDDLADLADELDLSEDFADDEDLDDDDEGLVFASEGNQMSTKLDLARAYIDMGDEDGARQILEEVALEGSSDQQQDARELMARLG